MKKSITVLSIFLLTIGCEKKEGKVVSEDKFVSFGDSISAEKAITREEMFVRYAGMRQGDTIEVKFRSTINDVCQKKGCWMNLALTDNESAFVKFKDYAFFMPLNSKDEEVIVSGKAFVSIETIDELKHYARDGGKSQAAIDSIVEPKTTYSFVADGVLIKE